MSPEAAADMRLAALIGFLLIIGFAVVGSIAEHQKRKRLPPPHRDERDWRRSFTENVRRERQS